VNVPDALKCAARGRELPDGGLIDRIREREWDRRGGVRRTGGQREQRADADR
jgi:hypothetical protein